jgi:tetratricopeptide (TPR) repeat protein
MQRLAPALKDGKLAEAADHLRTHWTNSQLIALLGHQQSDIRKVAALALGLTGDQAAIAPLAVALHDRDALVAQLAENSLWRVWFRAGKCPAVHLVKMGSCHLNHGNYDVAVEKFTQAIGLDPDYAEAYNQRAIAYYLADNYTASIIDCKAALARIPQHFLAMSGMGHNHLNLQEWEQARHCYRLALAIHPRLEGIAAALHQVEAIIRDRRGG